MDLIPSRSIKGRARSDSQPHVSSNQFHGTRPGQPQQHVVSFARPRLSYVHNPQPRQPAHVSMMQMPNWSNQPTRPSLPQLSSPQTVGSHSFNSSNIV